MPEREALAKYLKEYRKIYNETQVEFAFHIGISVEACDKRIFSCMDDLCMQNHFKI